MRAIMTHCLYIFYPIFQCGYSDVSIKNIDILPNRKYLADIADSAKEQYS